MTIPTFLTANEDSRILRKRMAEGPVKKDVPVSIQQLYFSASLMTKWARVFVLASFLDYSNICRWAQGDAS